MPIVHRLSLPAGTTHSMKAVFEFIVVILFFITFVVTKNIIWATSIAVAAGILQAMYCWLKHRKMQTMQWVSLLLVVVFGGATIISHNEHFIMWKPSVLFWLMAVALGGAQLMGKNILKAAIGKEISLPPNVWLRLTIAWIVFLTFLGALNLWVAYHYTIAQWVNYKLFGSMGLLFVFVVVQTLYLSRYLKKDAL